MKVAVFGAAGIIGQHMRLHQPAGFDVRYYRRRQADPYHLGLDLTDPGARSVLGGKDVIVNLAGANATDGAGPESERINVTVPGLLAAWTAELDARMIQVSTQAVFAGDRPPYGPDSKTDAANEYGRQKAAAERSVLSASERHHVVRPTFILGRRPLPLVGRPNPVELFERQPRQVSDRWFSPAFAHDVARQLWQIVFAGGDRIIHLGIPEAHSRLTVARALGHDCTAARHVEFEGLAERPLDTTYRAGARHSLSFPTGIEQLKRELTGADDSAIEIAFFLRRPLHEVKTKLAAGFAALHAEVAGDFRAAAPESDDRLLDWYRTTESYIWELTAYHDDPRLNYAGLIDGISERLEALRIERVLCCGDGTGALTISLQGSGLAASYHDLAASRTASFAAFRFWRHFGRQIPADLTADFRPVFSGGPYGAVVALDFFEHLPNVEQWIQAVADVLEPGGWLVAQNAFGIGSGPDGSIPCHLAVNDRFVDEWDQVVAAAGFRPHSPGWYQLR